MSQRRFLGFAAMCAIGCSNGAPSGNEVASSPQAKFWSWFVENSSSTPAPEELEKRLHEVNGGLTWEVSVDSVNGVRELTVSADGDRSLFPVVRDLVAAAPKVKGWRIIALRQPGKGTAMVQLNGIAVDPRKVRFVCQVNGDLADLRLFIPDYESNGDETRGSACFILLDSLVGEYLVETAVGRIDFAAIEEAPKNSRPLTELPRTSPFAERIRVGDTVPK